MADCSAAGTTIDRAARAVLGGGNSSASKHVGALLGHAASMPASPMPMPVVKNPDQLVLPGGGTVRAPVNAVQQQPPPPQVMQPTAATSHPVMDQAWNSGNAVQMMSSQQHPAMIQQQQQRQHQHHMQQQHRQHMQFQMQQQHMAMMLQQQQQQQLARQKQSQSTSSKQTSSTQHQQHISLEGWYEGLEQDLQNIGHEGIVEGASMEQLAAAWAQAEAEYELQDTADNVTVGDGGIEGMAQPAGIQELAAAWEQAERDYDQVLLDSQVTSDYPLEEEDYANMWQGSGPESEADHITQPYRFQNTMPQDEMAKAKAEATNFMEEGMRYFQEGNLKDAIRSFETELQQKDPDNATAWRMLGRCHAENDQDPEAIKCLEAAVDRDPYSPEALLALGVSYVNELNHERALENMKAWFTHNPKYAGMELPNSLQEEDIYSATEASATTPTNSRDSAFEEVKRMLEAALEFDPTDAGDVHEALGVIYNVIKDYDAATVSFRKALETRPDDYQLWNKLGATLANGSHSDQALPAYHQALQIKPKYARAWLNMAISHSNMQDHDEAARCYLQTLSLNPGAVHCWTYLRMALSSRERWDLLPLVFSRDLSGFQQHFDFVMY